MTTAPVLNAEQIIIDAFKAALAPYVGLWNGRPKAYYQQAEQNAPLPFVIFQAQADIGRLDWIDQTGAEVLMTVKALAANGTTARALLNDITPGMAALASAGYTITARYERSPAIPPTATTHQAAHIYRVRIERI
jgi:hypothetical protein